MCDGQCKNHMVKLYTNNSQSINGKYGRRKLQTLANLADALHSMGQPLPPFFVSIWYFLNSMKIYWKLAVFGYTSTAVLKE